MPDADPRFIQVLVEAWRDSQDDNKPTAMGTRLRHSDAGKCARALSFTAAGFERSDPMDLAGVWNVSLGTLLHEKWQEALQARYPDAEIEVKVGHDDLDASGHIDAVIRLDGKVTAYELKSIGGYGWKMAIGKGRGAATGPKSEHMAQSALNALAVGADEMVIGYLAKECVSAGAAGKLTDIDRFSGEWTFTREDFEPIALAEKERMAGVLALVDKGKLAARKVPFDMPPRAEIVDVLTSRWEEKDADGKIVDTGTLWNGQFCAYCSYRSLCATTQPGRIDIDSVLAVRGAA